MKVFFDTNIFIADYQLKSIASRIFFDQHIRAGHSLCVPQLVIDEVENKFSESLTDLKNEIEDKVSEIGRLTGKAIEPPIDEAFIQTTIQSYKKEFGHRLSSAKAKILEYPTVSHKELVSRALSRKRPFKGTDRAYRDALIWESILDIMTQDRQSAAFITNDTGFYEGKAIHPDLVTDVKARGLQPDQVTLFEKLEKFNDKHITPHLEILNDVREKLSKGIYPEFDLRGEIQERLSDYVWRIEPMRRAYQHLTEMHKIYVVKKLGRIEVRDVRKLSSGEFLIEVEADAEYQVEFAYVGSEIAYPSGSFFPHLENRYPSGSYAGGIAYPGGSYDPTWDSLYGAGSYMPEVASIYQPDLRSRETGSISFILNITFDDRSKKITSMEMRSIPGVAQITL